MTITKIELQKKNKNRASIYIDDEFAFGVHVNVVYDFGLKSGMEIDEDLKQKILSSDAVKQARLYAVKLIDYRPRCEAEVRKKMKEKEMKQNPNLPHCILVDMDATLFLNTNGRPFYGDDLEPTDILKDEPIPAVVTLVKAYQATGNLVIGLSGRENKPQIRACTLKQCENVGIHLDALILRSIGSRKRGDVSKKELFEEYIKDK